MNQTRRGVIAAGIAAAAAAVPSAAHGSRGPIFPDRPTFADVRYRLARIRGRMRWGRVNDAAGVARLRRDVDELAAAVEQLVGVLDQRPIR